MHQRTHSQRCACLLGGGAPNLGPPASLNSVVWLLWVFATVMQPQQTRRHREVTAGPAEGGGRAVPGGEEPFHLAPEAPSLHRRFPSATSLG